jgi:hypothetical protein
MSRSASILSKASSTDTAGTVGARWSSEKIQCFG